MLLETNLKAHHQPESQAATTAAVTSNETGKDHDGFVVPGDFEAAGTELTWRDSDSDDEAVAGPDSGDQASLDAREKERRRRRGRKAPRLQRENAFYDRASPDRAGKTDGVERWLDHLGAMEDAASTGKNRTFMEELDEVERQEGEACTLISFDELDFLDRQRLLEDGRLNETKNVAKLGP